MPELLLGRKYGHAIHIWDLEKRSHLQTLDLGDAHQMALELRPAHHPDKVYGFVNSVVSVEDLSASIWVWHRDGDTGEFSITKVIDIPAEPAEAGVLPPLLQGFGAVPAARDRHRPLGRRPIPLRLVLGDRRAAPVRRLRPLLSAALTARSASAASSTGLPIRLRMSRSAAARRWWRSAGMGAGCISPTPSTAPGTTSSTPTASAPGWSSSTSTRPAGWRSTVSSS